MPHTNEHFAGPYVGHPAGAPHPGTDGQDEAGRAAATAARPSPIEGGTRARNGVAELWRRYRQHGDQEAREALIVAYSPLVSHAARQVRANLPAHVDPADLASYGAVGLIRAVDRFSPEHETSFDGYAMVRIRGAILDELRVLDWVPRSVRSRARDIERATVRLRCTLQRQPTDPEIAEQLDVGIDELEGWLVEISNSGLAALDESWNAPRSDREGPSRSERLADADATDPARLFEASEVKDRVAQAIARLPAREQLVVGLYYYEGLSLREIAELVGLSKTGVAQLRVRAVGRLNAWIGDEGIEALLAE
jgi:RNA polymerase sigma factor for flagellar operon FliA